MTRLFGQFNLQAYMSENSCKKEIVEFGRRLYNKGFIAGTDGNLSVKLGKNKILITPSGYSKGFLYPEEMIVVDTAGKRISGYGEPSSELIMHLTVYDHRKDISACCHAHPPYITALSTVGKKPPFNLLPEAALTIGEIALTEYAPPGTELCWNLLLPGRWEVFGDKEIFLKEVSRKCEPKSMLQAGG